MKHYIFLPLVFILVFMSLGQALRAQDGLNVAGGYGSPEMLNAGIRVRVGQQQFGLGVGTNPGFKHANVSVNGDFYYHFGGRSSHTDLQPWYVKGGLTYMQNEDEWEERVNLVLVPRLGREFNLSDQFGIALEAGLMVMLVNKDKVKLDGEDEASGDLDIIGSGTVLASAGFKIFYRL